MEISRVLKLIHEIVRVPSAYVFETCTPHQHDLFRHSPSDGR